MCKASELARRLSKKRPFFYKIDSELYCIGMSLFEPCTEEESEIYQEFVKELEEIDMHLERLSEQGRFSFLNNTENLRPLLDSFEKLQTCRVEQTVNLDEAGYFAKKLYEKIKDLSPEELAEISKQVDDFERVLDYEANFIWDKMMHEKEKRM